MTVAWPLCELGLEPAASMMVPKELTRHRHAKMASGDHLMRKFDKPWHSWSSALEAAGHLAFPAAAKVALNSSILSANNVRSGQRMPYSSAEMPFQHHAKRPSQLATQVRGYATLVLQLVSENMICEAVWSGSNGPVCLIGAEAALVQQDAETGPV
eukprot:CAMPEP_0117647968 /NCGR_PEP_ID=MMETSP0804-20121206/132_1 /TAXON_ID=1074897 /ORGANISM="Tetraselmis astigmatica, Strain CCMP880" /LENGTH=155 /DNA_ID=CAMNT_0005453495 /DNA_START=134 /DNA_END=602 /DNA_ORIENTATION=+